MLVTFSIGIILFWSTSAVLSHRRVIRLTPKLRAQGFDDDIDLGEVISEVAVDSPEACRQLCEDNPSCHSVMLMGQLCRMFAYHNRCTCHSDLIRLGDNSESRYLIGRTSAASSFQAAMDKCRSMDAHSIHIDSAQEYQLITQYIWNSDLGCPVVWTGGWSHFPEIKTNENWRWYFSNDFTAHSKPVTYFAWSAQQPNNNGGNQYALALVRQLGYGYADVHFIASVMSQHVMRLTPKLRAQGFDDDIDLGEVISEAAVDSPEGCRQLCAENPSCHSVMLMGQLCRMFAYRNRCTCSGEVIDAAQQSRYTLVEGIYENSFSGAMDKCRGRGAHTVHINSKQEHDAIKKYIAGAGVQCRYVWTGAWSEVPGSTTAADWRWRTGEGDESLPFTYFAWGKDQPNNVDKNQHAIVLDELIDYDFNDFWPTYDANDAKCYMCECP